MIDISINKLGIPWSGLSYDQIRTFFESAKSEDDQLEFKSYADKPTDEWCKELSKEVCAFLNSGGGILIWGSPKETKENGIKICKGPLTNVPDFDTDDLIRRVAGKIKELPRGLKVKKLSGETGNIYVFQIEVSEYRPHQTDDRYFMRVNAESRPAPHHFVEALMKRVRYPDLRGSLLFNRISYSKGIHGVSGVRLDLSVLIENYSPFQNEESPRFIIYCDHGIPIDHYEEWPPPKVKPIDLRSIHDSALEIVHYGEKFQRNYSLGFDYYNLKSEGFIVNVILKFGGRYSPLKISNYEVDLTFLNPLVHIEDEKYEFSDKFVEAKENVLISDSEFNMNDLYKWNSIEN